MKVTLQFIKVYVDVSDVILTIICLYFRFSSYCPERSPSSPTRVEVDSHECNLKCRTILFILWWCSNAPYSGNLLDAKYYSAPSDRNQAHILVDIFTLLLLFHMNFSSLFSACNFHDLTLSLTFNVILLATDIITLIPVKNFL